MYVFQIGFFVSPRQPWLGVSLDGVVIKDDCLIKIVELKCPFSCMNKPIFDEHTRKCNIGFLEVDVNGNIELVKSHSYYTQCQVQMYVTGQTL